MTLKYSTGLRNFLQRDGGMKRALHNGAFKIYSGSAPADADAAVTGTLLTTVSLSSGAITKEVLSTGTVTLTGSGGQVDTLTVNSIEVMGEVVVYSSDLTTTAALVAAAINKNLSNPNYTASSSGAVITISALPNTVTQPNTYVVACTQSGGTLGDSATDMAGGVAAVNGLPFADVVAGALTKSGVWSGVNGNTGTAGYFRYESTVTDAGGSSALLMRIQGTCGTSGADYNMSSTSLTSGATHTIDTFTLTLPAS